MAAKFISLTQRSRGFSEDTIGDSSVHSDGSVKRFTMKSHNTGRNRSISNSNNNINNDGGFNANSPKTSRPSRLTQRPTAFTRKVTFRTAMRSGQQNLTQHNDSVAIDGGSEVKHDTRDIKESVEFFDDDWDSDLEDIVNKIIVQSSLSDMSHSLTM